MALSGTGTGVSRRNLLIGGGAGIGLVVAWRLWPRRYEPNLRAADGETLFNAFLKIGGDGRVIVAVPQAEMGQGVYTSLPQIVADELGADWRTVAVEPAPISPLYANSFLAEEAAGDGVPSALRGVVRWAAREQATRAALMITGGSTSIRAFEPRLREAGAAARALLSKAAAERWDVEWELLDTRAGFVVNGGERLSFAELAEAAAAQELPEHLPVRGGLENRLTGQSLPRIDLPSKVDGSARFAGDVRLPDMVYASVRQGPIGGGPLASIDRDAAEAVPGVVALFETPRWVGAAASNWWAANRAVEAMKPAFINPPKAASSAGIEAALAQALEADEGERAFERGDVAAAYAGAPIFRARYSAGVAPNAPLETLTATARITGDRLEVWAPTQAPSLARAAAARAAGFPEARVTVYPMLVGGGYGRKIETIAIEQAVTMTAQVKRPVQLVWSRIEETMQDSFRPPAAAVMSASMMEGGRLTGWQARIAAPATTDQVIGRLDGAEASGDGADPAMVDGAVPPYDIPSVAIDHLPADTGLRTGLSRSGAHGYTAFFTESFVDELARQARVEPLSFRMQMLGSNPRLARCLSTAAALGGWDGGGAGSNMGIAAHSAFGSHVATLVEVEVDKDQRIRVTRAVSAVDCGRAINPDIVRQLIEGGICHGIAAATGRPIGIEGGLVDARGFGDLGLPTLAYAPEVTVEIIASQEPPGGVTELGVPTIAPAIANALFAATGQRLRSLPLVPGSGQ
ncbi:molybdopterin cofactor-binding domain-containing protein [Enterovirga sp. GCM10030262]|uniref:xanthine dehydrogenase family protein molybdopterin-binding subunit n=1 Tax=Enterovirga sp. GCM10030262 TaxID=3273391 RepID=UPI00360DD299